MARTSAAPKSDNSKPISSGILNPQASDPKLELFYMLGVLRGANVEGSIRIAELVNLILTPPAEEQTPGGE